MHLTLFRSINVSAFKHLILQIFRAVTYGRQVGYIHGHDHRWYTRDMGMGWKSAGAKRTLCLPSTGAWGDIGYALMRTSKDRAVASLVQREFYYPRPPKPGAPVQHLWNAIVEANRNQTCAFAIPENI